MMMPGILTIADNRRFSFFKHPITNLLPLSDAGIQDIYQFISGDIYEEVTYQLRSIPSESEQSKFKREKLDYVTFSGVFSQRRDNAIVQRSQYFAIDLDHLEEIESVRTAILENLKPALIFVSPRGAGLKVIYRIEVNAGEHLQFFFAFERYFNEVFGLQIDPECKNPSRACFLSHDPGAVFSDNPDVLGREFLDTYSKPEPRLEPPPPPASPRNDHDDVMSVPLGMIRNSKDGEKHGVLLRASRLAGGFIAAGLISEAEAIRLLEHEISLKNIDSFPTAQRTIKDGIQEGKVFPTLPRSINEEKIIKLSEKEFVYDIFTFELKQHYAILTGLYRTGIIEILTQKGYAKRYLTGNSYRFIREVTGLIEEVEPVMMKDDMFRDLCDNYPETLKFDYKGVSVSTEFNRLKETFLKQSHLVFNQTFLEHLLTHTKPILRDTKTHAFFPFQNVIVRVTAKDITPVQYSALKDYCIWRKHILKRSYEKAEHQGCHFDQFINNVAADEPDRIAAFKSAIGYLCHNYGHRAQGQAVIAYDEEITDLKHPQGGTGKGIVKQAISQVRTVVTIDGKKFDERDRFCFQDVDETSQVVFFDDVRADLGFERFNSLLTEGWSIEKKMKPSFTIDPENSPKVYIASNAIISGEGTTIERRQFVIEFSPFYSRLIRQKLRPIEFTHGCEFFGSDWTDKDWNQFFNYMMNCVQYYLSKGLQYYSFRGLSENKLRQSTSDDFSEWVANKNYDDGNEFNIGHEYIDFKSMYYGDNIDFRQRTFTNWLKIYALTKDMQLNIRTSNGERIAIFKAKK
jgi:hypothetical protein